MFVAGTLGFTLRNRLDSTLWLRAEEGADEDGDCIPQSYQVLIRMFYRPLLPRQLNRALVYN